MLCIPAGIKRSIDRGDQGLVIGLGRLSGGTVQTLEQSVDIDSIVRRVVCQSDQAGTFELRLNGQLLNASDQPGDIASLANNAANQGWADLMLPIPSSRNLRLETTIIANGFVVGSAAVDPWPESHKIPELANLGTEVLRRYFGLGATAVAAGATVTFSATCRNDCILGLLELTATTVAGALADDDLMLTDISINNTPLMNGSGAVPLVFFDPTNPDQDGRDMKAVVKRNDTVSFTVLNNDAVNAKVVRGNIWTHHPRHYVRGASAA